MSGRLYPVDQLDLDPILTRIAARGLAEEAFPVIEAAIRSLTEKAGGEGVEFDDLLLHLAVSGQGAVTRVLVEETGGWLRDHLEEEPVRRADWERHRIPHAAGYGEARSHAILRGMEGDVSYGAGCGGLDERVVEYPWVFDRLSEVHPAGARVLDAGSTMNHQEILAEWRTRGFGPLSIVTLHHEGKAFLSEEVRYEFGDLRRLAYRDDWFRSVLCVSTLEHVGMDNRIYGDRAGRTADAEEAAVGALGEIVRVMERGGTLLLSVPFGRRADRGWQRIFDWSALDALLYGELDRHWDRLRVRVFRSFRDGWREVAPEEAADAGYNDPQEGGVRDAPEWVAAAEAVALVEAVKR